MRVWGVDLGVRTAYAAGLSTDNSLEVSTYIQRPNSRSRELRLLHEWAQETFGPDDVLYIEEPPLAGARNLRTFLHLSQVSGVMACTRDATLVPVSSWKKGTVGNGSATKDLVSRWLSRRYPEYHRVCTEDQNLIDATCLALYGCLDQGRPRPDRNPLPRTKRRT